MKINTVFKLAVALLFVVPVPTLMMGKTPDSPSDSFRLLKIHEFKEPSPALDFTLISTEGEKMSLSDFRGKVVLLNFWTTW